MDLLVLTEVHMPAGEPVQLEGYQLCWEPRKCMVGHGPRGGVAFAVRDGLPTPVVSLAVEEVCSRADVAWARVEFGGAQRPLYVAAVYLPPVGTEHCCSGCGTPACIRAHVSEALAYLHETAGRMSTQGDVLIAGDFNVRVEQAQVTPRWRDVQDWLLDEDGCVVVSPVDNEGRLLPTRCDPSTGVESVLDLVLAGVANAGGLQASVDRNATLSDHYPILVDVAITAAGGGDGPPPFPPAYGFRSSVPRYLRRKPAVAVSRSSVQMDEFKMRVDELIGTLPAMEQGVSVDVRVGVIEKALLRAAYDVGLCDSGMSKDPAVRVFTVHQRQLEAARKHVRKLEATGAVGELEAAQREVQRLQQRKRDELPLRRAEQRRRRRAAREAAVLERHRLFVANEVGLLAQRMTEDQAGALSRRPKRSLVPLCVRQRELWRRQVALEAKYSRADPRFKLDPWKEDIPEAQVHVPSLQEVEKAVAQLNGNSAAVGVPVFPLHWASTPAVLQEVCKLFGVVWRSGHVPSSFCCVEAVALPKPGSTDYRIIGVGSALGRLFRLVMYNRTLGVVRLGLDPTQFGFLPQRSTEHASFLATSSTQCVQAVGRGVETVFLDLASAYASTTFPVIMQRLREAGVPTDLLRLNTSFYRQQRLFVKVGRLISDWVEVNIGLSEGDVLSPLHFIVVIDPAVRRLHSAVLRNNAAIGLPMLDGSQLSCVWYADDGRLFASKVEGMRCLLDMATEDFTGMEFKFNSAPTKSAVQFHPPHGKAARARERRQRGLVEYELQGSKLPAVQQYKYVGVMTDVRGPTASRAAQARKLAVTAAAVVRQATTTPLLQRSILYASRLYTTYWLPKFMYAVGLYAETPAAPVQHAESVVLRLMMRAANTPLVVLRSIIGLPTLQTRLDLDRLRVLLRFLAGPPRDLVRQQLAVECALHERLSQGAPADQATARKLWWDRTVELLRVMDMACDAEFRAANPMCPPSWLLWARSCASRWEEDVLITAEVKLLVRRVLLVLEERRRRWEIRRCWASLEEVEELVDTPNVAPFIVDTRCDLSLLRVQLRGGRRVLFGHQHFHLDSCPWCGLYGEFNVRHLLRDCGHWEQRRIAIWESARGVAALEAVQLDGGDVYQHRDWWYRFTCGAAVPNDIIGMHLDASSHFARGETSATRHMRVSVAVYLRMLAITGAFIREVVERTRELLAAGNPLWSYTPEGNQPRVTINHRAREAALLHHFAGVQ